MDIFEGIGTCLLPCEGLAKFEHHLTAFARNVTGGYEMTMFIPWALFEPKFRPAAMVVDALLSCKSF